MKKIEKEELLVCGKRMMFALTEEELNTIQQKVVSLTAQLDNAEKIEGFDKVEPMTFPFLCEMPYLREDIATEKVDRDVLFSNTKDVVDGQIRLPKVVG